MGNRASTPMAKGYNSPVVICKYKREILAREAKFNVMSIDKQDIFMRIGLGSTREVFRRIICSLELSSRTLVHNVGMDRVLEHKIGEVPDLRWSI